MADGDGELSQERISRRALIRRGAVLAGATVWAVPVIHRLGSNPASPTHVDTGPAAEPNGIVLQQLSSTCEGVGDCIPAPACGSVLQCGEAGLLICFCAPLAAGGCGCVSDVFCDEAAPCDPADPMTCPDGACLQGCCDFPVCLPPCPAPAPAPLEAQVAAGARKTASGVAPKS